MTTTPPDIHELPDWLITKAGDALHMEVNLDTCEHCEKCEHDAAERGEPGPVRECNGCCDAAAAVTLGAVLDDLYRLWGARYIETPEEDS